MVLVRLVYCSRAAVSPVRLEDVIAIASSSGERNRSASITGALIFDRETYLQALEGPRAAVNALYHGIARDRRHRDVTILAYEEIPARGFEKWSMGFLGPLAKRPELLDALGDDTFFEMRVGAVARFLRAVSDSALLT